MSPPSRTNQSHYGLGGPWIESRWGARSSAPTQINRGAHSVSYTMGTGSFQRIKRSECAVNHPPPSSAEVRERVDLYLYSSCVPSWQVIGLTLPLITNLPPPPVPVPEELAFMH